MRLFIALQLNDAMREALLDEQASMRMLGVTGNYTKEENLHLTLAFIGEYSDPYHVLEVIESIRFEPFTITLSETGTFDQIWWAGIEENDRLTALVRKLRRRLAEEGIPFDRKKFLPHITLSRKPSCRGRMRTSDVLRGLPEESMTVDHISLMRSDRGKDGVIYTEVV